MKNRQSLLAPKALVLSLLALTCANEAFARVVTIRLGQSASCDNFEPGSVIVITGAGQQSAVTCGVGNHQPRRYFTCYSTLHNGSGGEPIGGNGATKREAMANAIQNCREVLRSRPFGACQTSELVIMETCEERIED